MPNSLELAARSSVVSTSRASALPPLACCRLLQFASASLVRSATNLCVASDTSRVTRSSGHSQPESDKKYRVTSSGICCAGRGSEVESALAATAAGFLAARLWVRRAGSKAAHGGSVVLHLEQQVLRQLVLVGERGRHGGERRRCSVRSASARGGEGVNWERIFRERLLCASNSVDCALQLHVVKTCSEAEALSMSTLEHEW